MTVILGCRLLFVRLDVRILAKNFAGGPLALVAIYMGRATMAQNFRVLIAGEAARIVAGNRGDPKELEHYGGCA